MQPDLSTQQPAARLPGPLAFRAIEPADAPLLCAIYASTRREEMDLLPHWSEADKTAFLEQQFQAQHAHYQKAYSRPDFQLIYCGDEPAGRLYLDRRPDEIRIVDITLLPDFRGLGLGACLLRRVLDEASRAGHRVSIHVERHNRALHLYDRLGFRMVDDTHPIYLLLEWNPAA